MSDQLGGPAEKLNAAINMPAYPSLAALFLSFLKLGATAFGGPAVVPFIGKMAVEQDKWLEDRIFRDGVALCQTIAANIIFPTGE